MDRHKSSIHFDTNEDRLEHWSTIEPLWTTANVVDILFASRTLARCDEGAGYKFTGESVEITSAAGTTYFRYPAIGDGPATVVAAKRSRFYFGLRPEVIHVVRVKETAFRNLETVKSQEGLMIHEDHDRFEGRATV